MGRVPQISYFNSLYITQSPNKQRNLLKNHKLHSSSLQRTGQIFQNLFKNARRANEKENANKKNLIPKNGTRASRAHIQNLETAKHLTNRNLLLSFTLPRKRRIKKASPLPALPPSRCGRHHKTARNILAGTLRREHPSLLNKTRQTASKDANLRIQLTRTHGWRQRHRFHSARPPLP